MNFSNDALNAWRDRALAAERRLDDLLERLYDPESKLVLGPAKRESETKLQERTYISDEPYHDAVWREHKGIESEDEETPEVDDFVLANEGAE